MKKKLSISIAFFAIVLLAVAFLNCSQFKSNDASNPSNNVSGGDLPTEQDRIQAATVTANTNPNCSIAVLTEGFYWEIGDRDGAKISGSIDGTDTPTPTQVIAIASASKWIYSTYVLQKLNGYRPSDIPFLHFTSGFVYPVKSSPKEATCPVFDSVGDCAAEVTQNPNFVDKFYYSAGHFQYHAANIMGLASMKAADLTTEITNQIGKFDFVYLQTNIAGGLNASAAGYAAFLQKMLRGEYVMSSYLDAEKVCASAACTAGAALSPAPKDEEWNYSLGHWVEDDPQLGDHAYSCAGALGFYPWIDASKTWYGVFARRASEAGGNEGVRSMNCGRLIRQAWLTGKTVNGTTPTP